MSKAEMGIALLDIISLVIGFILLVNMLPTALTQFYSQNTGTWLSGGTKSVKSPCILA